MLDTRLGGNGHANETSWVENTTLQVYDRNALRVCSCAETGLIAGPSWSWIYLFCHPCCLLSSCSFEGNLLVDPHASQSVCPHPQSAHTQPRYHPSANNRIQQNTRLMCFPGCFSAPRPFRSSLVSPLHRKRRPSYPCQDVYPTQLLPAPATKPHSLTEKKQRLPVPVHGTVSTVAATGLQAQT